ncbi:MAG: ATP cone domain-containing protein [Candidatus Aminicenantia bacterium]
MARSKIKISKIQKRDGRIVDFDPERITNVIYKSTEGVGEPNFDLAKELTKKVVENLEKKLPSKKIPTVEEVQDAVEKVLIEAGQARVAKAFILYRQKRAEIRKEKQQILNKTKIDEVDKRFDINALRVLRSRYLKKDEAGKVLESPKQLFERVATHAILPSLFYDKKVSQKRGKQHPEEKFKPEKWGGKIKIGDFTLNQFHLEALKRLYDRFNKNRKTKIKFSELLKLLKKGKFDKYQKEIRDYYNLMAERKFMPNTPALANFGKYLGMGSACFALDIDDSIESIMDTLRKATIIFKSGGGVGYNFSKLRPEGDFVKSSGGRASGPISFMTLFDQMTEVIRQGGIRRGANMGILDINHPDIEKFIVAKRGNVALRNFNISVFIKSDFWDYYRKKKLYPLINPRNKEIVKNVDPVTLFDLIVYQGWESAEPGVVFGENINKYNPLLKSLGPIRTTNPCVVGNTLVAVADGRNYVPIKQLAKEKKDVPVYCYGNGKVQIRIGRNPRKTREKVPVWKVTLDDRSHIIATEDHKFRNRNNNEIKLKDLRPGTILMPFYKFQYSATGKRSNYWGITQNNGERARAEYRMIAEFYLGRKIKKYPKEIVHHTNTNGLDNRIENLKIMNQGEHDSFHQTGERNVMKGKWWRKLSKEEKEVYRRKMSQAVSGEKNGMFGKRHKRETKELLSKTRKRYFQNSKNRKLLSQRIAQLYKEHPEIKEKISRAKTKYQFINSNCLNCDKTIKYKPYEKRIFCSHSCTASFINRIRNTENVKRTKAKRREDLRRALYRLGIRFTEEKNRFPKYKEFRELAKKRGYSGDVRSTFGGFTNFKEELLLHNHKVVSIEFYGYEDVYNITVDDFHTVAYITNPNTKTKFTKKPLLSGIITSQCGELPLYGNESCNLGSINVWAFVREKQSNSRKREVGFDWKDFERTIKITTRFLDNVIDVNHYPLPEIEEMTLNTRKMGLGIMGLGDLLYDLEIPYNSNEGLDFMERLMEFLNYHSKITSIELAKERGKFPLRR